MKFKIIVLILIMALCKVFASEELEVLLSTQNPLTPVYIANFNDETTAFAKDYSASLKKVFEFDLNYNGRTIVVKELNTKTPFCVKVKIVKKELFVDVITNTKQKTSSSMELSGDLNIDRRRIHLMHDELMQKLFNEKGVAALRLLYTVRVPHPNSDGQKWLSEVWLCDYDGNNKRQITFENSYCVHPVFLPDERDNFIYVSYKSGLPKIYHSNLKNSFSTPVLSIRGNQLLPAVTHNKIAFICDAAGRPDLFLQKLGNNYHEEGKAMQLFAAPRSTQASPTFSPDGSKIAFVSDKDGSPRIYLMKIPQQEFVERPMVHLLTKKNAENVAPSWSYDGTKLAFSAKTDGVRQIWIYDFTTGQEWQLTKGPENKENPMWAPDNLHLVYNTEDKESSELYIINLNQPQAVKISGDMGKKRFAVWEPYQ
jgi:TolB protein